MTPRSKIVQKNLDAYADKNVGITRQGKQIILPEIPVPMTEEVAIDYLQRKLKQDEMIVAINEEIDCHPLEGAWALKKVLESRYGWAESKPKEGFFGPIPPAMINLEVAHEVYEQVIWGCFQLPGIEADLECGGTRDNKFRLGGKAKKKYQVEIADVANTIRAYLKTNSIYKSQAIRLEVNYDGELNIDNPPRFVDLSKVKEEELIFSKDLMQQVETNLFTPVEHTDFCRKHKIPLKRGVLMEGPYGTGKTLAAYVTAKKATANGWTFVYLNRVAGLQQTIEFARRYEPCVIFAEDIDRAMDGERDEDTDDILNTIDGIQNKNSEIMVVLTTNDVNSIEKAMLRPGRLDAVLSFKAPDQEAAEKLIRLYARGLIPAKENLKLAAAELAGTIPAVIREVVERSKLYAISRGQTTNLKLNGDDIADAAKGMKQHLALLNGPPTDKTTDELLGHALRKTVVESFNGHLEKIEQVHEWVQNQ